MGAKFPYLLLLYWIFATLEARATLDSDYFDFYYEDFDEIDNLCEGDQLLLEVDQELIGFCLKTNQTIGFAQGAWQRISYSPQNGGTIVATRFGQDRNEQELHSMPHFAENGHKITTTSIWLNAQELVIFNPVNTSWKQHTVINLRSQPSPCSLESACGLLNLMHHAFYFEHVLWFDPMI